MDSTVIGTSGMLGHALRDARLRHGWSQRELAARAGVSQRYVSELECGKGSVTFERLTTVVSTLGLRLRLETP